MDINCHLSGAHARKFPEFCYRVPIRLPVVPSVEPEAWAGVPSSLEYEELVDYCIRITENDSGDSTRTVQVWLLPNQYTQAQTERLMATFSVTEMHIHAPELPAMLEEIARSVLLSMA